MTPAAGLSYHETSCVFLYGKQRNLTPCFIKRAVLGLTAARKAMLPSPTTAEVAFLSPMAQGHRSSLLYSP